MACVGNQETRRGGPNAASAGPVVEAAGPHAPRWVGRGEDTEAGRRFAWSGSSATVHFRGTALSVDLTDSGQNQFLVLVDGKPLREKVTPVTGRSTVELVKGLPREAHTVTFYRLTEPLVGETVVHQFVLDPYGEPLPTPRALPRRIELLGDSISAGYGNEGTDPSCGFSPETENHFLTYGARAARELDAELVTLAWSGKGVFSNRGSSDAETYPRLWERVVPQDPASIWDFSAPAPDVVLINLGTNDFAPEVRDTAPFGAAYEALLTQVRARYPAAPILLLVGPSLRDDWPEGRRALSEIRATLQGLAARRAESGDDKIHYFEFAGIRPDEGFGCDFHPSEKTHRRMAAELLSELKRLLGW